MPIGERLVRFIEKHILRELILLVIGGVIYMGIELAYRQRTHWTMGLVGGLCFVAIGLINELFTFRMYMEVQAAIGAILVTFIELVSGIFLNLILGLGIWDYSNVPFNILGQICLPFTIIWFFLSIVAIFLDDKMRAKLFGDENYKLSDYVWWFRRIKTKRK